MPCLNKEYFDPAYPLFIKTIISFCHNINCRKDYGAFYNNSSKAFCVRNFKMLNETKTAPLEAVFMFSESFIPHAKKRALLSQWESRAMRPCGKPLMQMRRMHSAIWHSVRCRAVIPQ